MKTRSIMNALLAIFLFGVGASDVFADSAEDELSKFFLKYSQEMRQMCALELAFEQDQWDCVDQQSNALLFMMDIMQAAGRDTSLSEVYNQCLAISLTKEDLVHFVDMKACLEDKASNFYSSKVKQAANIILRRFEHKFPPFVRGKCYMTLEDHRSFLMFKYKRKEMLDLMGIALARTTTLNSESKEDEYVVLEYINLHSDSYRKSFNTIGAYIGLCSGTKDQDAGDIDRVLDVFIRSMAPVLAEWQRVALADNPSDAIMERLSEK